MNDSIKSGGTINDDNDDSWGDAAEVVDDINVVSANDDDDDTCRVDDFTLFVLDLFSALLFRKQKKT